MASHAVISSRTLDFIRYLVREIENADRYQDRSERCIELLECGGALYSHLEGMAMLGVVNSSVPAIVKDILGVLSDICNRRRVDLTTNHGLQLEAAVHLTGRRGRPRFILPEDSLRYLIENGFNVPSVSRILGVSIRTVRRRMADFGIYVSDTYTSITDSELDEKVNEIKESFPNSGSRILQGHLRSAGVHVQQHRIRESLRRIDPCGTMLRWFSAIQRRRYSVPHSQYLWHIDGNHKLIRCVYIAYSDQFYTCVVDIVTFNCIP